MEDALSQRPTGRSWALRSAAVTLASVVPVALTAIFGPQSGLEAMVILIPWAGMLAGHAIFGPVTLLLAWGERRRWLLASFGLYLTAFAALHLVWWAVASGVPEQLETEYLKRHRPADYALQRLPRDRDAGPEELEALLRAGADVNRRTPDGRTPLFDAASNAPALALALLEAGADANQVSGAAGLPLHAAVRNEDLALVKALFAHGALPDLPDENGRTVLCRLLGQSGQGGLSPLQLELLRQLLEAGADPNEACPAFRQAVRRRQPDALRALLDAGHRNAEPDDPAIEYALRVEARSRERDLAWVALLLEVGGDPNRPLRQAVERGDAELLGVLLEGGADPNDGLPLAYTAG
ncbi:MAG: hypothetical protein QNK03_28545, partial [Myxococcota bacterium]|nr:hypothetical protein [Myxococcota bacterium]